MQALKGRLGIVEWLTTAPSYSTNSTGRVRAATRTERTAAPPVQASTRTQEITCAKPGGVQPGRAVGGHRQRR